MFNQEFFPTPAHVIELMCEGLIMQDKTVLEPSAGKGDIVDYLKAHGAEVLACETNKDLQEILKSKCGLIEDDFFKLTSDKISHISAIVMNPPFSNADKHILHAYNIAPEGCKIIALCNLATITNTYTRSRTELGALIDNFGQYQNIGNAFNEAERRTEVDVALITLNKPGQEKSSEFEGFFMDEEPEIAGENGLMPYNFVRDLVNRYVAAIKIFDKQIETAVEMNRLTSSFYSSSIAMSISEDNKPKTRNDFKKDLQKSGWQFIFSKMNMQKHTTRGLREDINKFVEQQNEIPFTMKNIYRMLEIVIGTTSQRMDKALLEVFERVTAHHHDNRYNLPGWKTNGHFLVGKKFILPYQISPAKEYGYTNDYYNYMKNDYDGVISDLEKALCYITGEPFDNIRTISHSINRNSYGEWYDSHFFKYKGYKNGNMHFEFKDDDIWGRFNQRIAKLKGYPLFEYKKQTAYQARQTGRKTPEKKFYKAAQKPTILGEFKLAV